MIAECFLETIHQSSAHEFEELLQRRQAEDKALTAMFSAVLTGERQDRRQGMERESMRGGAMPTEPPITAKAEVEQLHHFKVCRYWSISCRFLAASIFDLTSYLRLRSASTSRTLRLVTFLMVPWRTHHDCRRTIDQYDYPLPQEPAS